jgi:probable HAF family extracellular repeat protein
MARRRILCLVAAILLVLALVGGAQATCFMGLGDLPGGDFESGAWGVSADGSVVVGSSSSASASQEAFLWTQTGGMVGLRDHPSGHLSEALGASAWIRYRWQLQPFDGSTTT